MVSCSAAWAHQLFLLQGDRAHVRSRGSADDLDSCERRFGSAVLLLLPEQADSAPGCLADMNTVQQMLTSIQCNRNGVLELLIVQLALHLCSSAAGSRHHQAWLPVNEPAMI